MAFNLPTLEKWLAKVAEHDRPHVEQAGVGEAWKHHFIKLIEANEALDNVYRMTEISARVNYAAEHGEDGWKWSDELEDNLTHALFSYVVSVISLIHTFSHLNWENMVEAMAAENIELANRALAMRENGSMPDFLKKLMGLDEDDPEIDKDGIIRIKGESFNV